MKRIRSINPEKQKLSVLRSLFRAFRLPAIEVQPRRGSALTTVIVIIASITALAAVVAVASLQRAYTAKLLSEKVRALAIAEAGANYAYSVLATNWAARTNRAAFPPTNYGDGKYAVTVKPVSSNYAIIVSTGTCRRATEWVMLDALNYSVGTRDTQSDAFNYAIVCGSTFTFRGCGSITSAQGTPTLHSNTDLDIQGSCNTEVDIRSSTKISIGNNITIRGKVTAPVVSYKPGKVTVTGGIYTQPVPLVTIPDIDLTPYYNWALARGEVKNGFTLSGGTYTANGGIIWVNGDVQISGQTTVNASIIATGNIKSPAKPTSTKAVTVLLWPAATVALITRPLELHVGLYIQKPETSVRRPMAESKGS